jgi:SAM-dependent methyltransferase
VATSDEVIRELYERAQGTDRLPQFLSIASGHQYRRLHRWTEEFVPAGSRVLDWGAGNGHYSVFLVRAGYRATGYSFEGFDFVDLFREGEYTAVAGDPSSPVALPFPDGCFDAVTSCGVLEHVREFGGNEAGSLAEIARVLRPGGVFLCYHFPNRHSWIEAVARGVPGRYSHRFRFGRRDIEGLVRGAGLRLERLVRYGVVPRNSLARLPMALRGAAAVGRSADLVDGALGLALRPVAQNWGFVARKA